VQYSEADRKNAFVKTTGSIVTTVRTINEAQTGTLLFYIVFYQDEGSILISKANFCNIGCRYNVVI